MSFENELYFEGEKKSKAGTAGMTSDNEINGRNSNVYSEVGQKKVMYKDNEVYWSQDKSLPQISTVLSKYYRVLLILSLVVSTISFTLLIFVSAGVIRPPAENKEFDISEAEVKVSKLVSKLKDNLNVIQPVIKQLSKFQALLNQTTEEAKNIQKNLTVIDGKLSKLRNAVENNTRISGNLSTTVNDIKTLKDELEVQMNTTDSIKEQISLLNSVTTTHAVQITYSEQEIKTLIKNVTEQQNKSKLHEIELSNLQTAVVNNTKVSGNLSKAVNDVKIFTDELTVQRNTTDNIKEQISLLNSVTTTHAVQLMSFGNKITALTVNATNQKNRSKLHEIEIKSITNQFILHKNFSDYILKSFERKMNNVYYFSTEKLNWHDADMFCQQKNMDLTSIHSPDENAYIASQVKKRGLHPAFIGLHDVKSENNFIWTDNTPSNFFNWASGEPNNLNDEDCVTVYDSGFWVDFKCDSKKHFICSL